MNMKPNACRVCGTNSIRPVQRKTVVFNADSKPVSGVLAYRCAHGHLFMLGEEAKAATQSE